MVDYNNYFEHHSYGIQLDENTPAQYKALDKKVGRFINPGAKILELWTGLGSFAHYCLARNLTDYTGIEVDQTVADALSKRYPMFKILADDAMLFFEQHTEKYDVIFLSHVFEHFSIEEGIALAKQIRAHLTPDGIWVNVMPNAWSISGALGRYNDITHKTIYTTNSYNQVLLEAGFSREGIQHYNVHPKGFLKKLLSIIIGKLIAIDYYTFELLSVINWK